MSFTDELLERAQAFADSFKARPPAHGAKVAVVACMDARLDPWRIFDLTDGEAHVIRNAGGVITDDEIRSIAISQRLLGSTEVILVHHTGCGMLTFTDDDFRRDIRKDTVSAPEWEARAFSDLDDSVRQSIALIKESRFIPHTDSVRGFVYELETGRLREVT